jgi:hypothetical protein
MPLLRNKYQPYFPDTDSPNNYNCGDEAYCHPVSLGDTVYTQFYQTPCNANEITDPGFENFTLGAEELTNGTFTGSAAGWLAGAGNPLPSDNWAYGTNDVVHTPGSDEPLYQTGLGLTVGEIYEIEITFTRTAGSLFVRLGLTSGSTTTPIMEETGTYTYQIPFLDAGVGDDNLYIVPSSDFDGSVTSVSLKLATYTDWDGNGSWEFSSGLACHTEGTTGLLEETVANYITANQYHKITVTVSGYVQGSCDVYVSDVLAGTISANGTFTYWCTPTVTGVVSFDPSSDFIGCISAPDLRELKNSHDFKLVTQDGGTEYDIADFASYYEDWVTLALNIEELEVAGGCYYIQAYDACQIEGNELVTNGTFGDGITGWTRNNNGGQYDFTGGDLQLILDPLSAATDVLSNGDFSGGTTDWTFGAGWALGGGGAQHTPGSTATLTQSLSLPVPPPPPTSTAYWVQFTVSGRTAGSVSVRLSNGTTYTVSTNNTFTYRVTPTTFGTVNLTFTPTSAFDGTIDDVSLWLSNEVWVNFPIATNQANTDIVSGNYELSFDITAQSDPRNGVAIQILGQSEATQYFYTVGTHTIVINNYTPGAQQVRIIGNFSGGSIGTVDIDNVSAVRIEPFEATYVSECLNYAESHARTKIMVAYCDQESFGFEFANTGFRLQQRAIIRSIAPTYPKEKQIMKSGTGSARVVYSGVEKYWQLHTTYASETFHDALAIMIDCDHFAIGDAQDVTTEYVAEVEDYTPQWVAGGQFALAPAVITLRVKTDGQKFNRHT